MGEPQTEVHIAHDYNLEGSNEAVLLTHHVGKLWNLVKETTVLQEKVGVLFS